MPSPPSPPAACDQDAGRLSTLGDAINQSRLNWRSLYGRFWQLRHENTVRRPSWRVEMETQAWKAMRAEVRRYGELRIQRRDLSGGPLRSASKPAFSSSRDSDRSLKVPSGNTGGP